MLLAVLLAVAQPKLDAPIDTHPTMRSEIRRGAAAAFDCQIGNETNALNLSLCVNRASSVNQQRMSQGYDAFDVGLYCHASELAKIIADVTHNQRDATDTSDLQKVCANLRAKISLSEAEVTAALRSR